jgi:hypothetical protein
VHGGCSRAAASCEPEPSSLDRGRLRAELGSFLRGHGGAEHFSGIAVRVTRPTGRPISAQVGTTRWHGGRPLTSNVWQIGSNTKVARIFGTLTATTRSTAATS